MVDINYAYGVFISRKLGSIREKIKKPFILITDVNIDEIYNDYVNWCKKHKSNCFSRERFEIEVAKDIKRYLSYSDEYKKSVKETNTRKKIAEIIIKDLKDNYGIESTVKTELRDTGLDEIIEIEFIPNKEMMKYLLTPYQLKSIDKNIKFLPIISTVHFVMKYLKDLQFEYKKSDDFGYYRYILPTQLLDNCLSRIICEEISKNITHYRYLELMKYAKNKIQHNHKLWDREHFEKYLYGKQKNDKFWSDIETNARERYLINIEIEKDLKLDILDRLYQELFYCYSYKFSEDWHRETDVWCEPSEETSTRYVNFAHSDDYSEIETEIPKVGIIKTFVIKQTEWDKDHPKKSKFNKKSNLFLKIISIIKNILDFNSSEV